MDENKLTDEIKAAFAKEIVVVHPYNDVYEFVKTLSETVIIDPKKINYVIFNNIPANVEKDNPTILFKAIKNEVKLSNISKSHIKDGIAFTKFMYWLKKLCLDSLWNSK